MATQASTPRPLVSIKRYEAFYRPDPLVIAGLGQTILFAFAWGMLGAVFVHDPLTLPYSVALLIYLNPTETTLVVTVIGAVLALATTSFFSIAAGAALREGLLHRMRSPISLTRLAGGIALVKCGLFNFHDIPMTCAAFLLFILATFTGSSWTTFINPTLVARNISATGGWELNLNSTYFESQLGDQLVLSGSALVQGNTVEIVNNDGLLSGIAAAQHSFGAPGTLNFNGVSYNVSTGGVIPAVSGFGSIKDAQQNITGLGFVGGPVPTNVQFPSFQAIFNNYTILQQGLTADVTCSQISQQTVAPPQTAPVAVSIFNGNTTYLYAYVYSMACSQGISAQQSYMVRAATNNATGNLVYSLVCPYPVGQSNLDFSRFNVTFQGIGKYGFLQLTTCEISPQLTTSLVTYADRTLNATTLSTTPLSSSNNANLALFLSSILQYQAGNSQGLDSNSIGDALYSIAVSTNVSLDNGGTMDPVLIGELEQYWRGIIEFFGTYLRSGFSAYPITIPADAQVNLVGYSTITTVGWSNSRPIYLYTVIPITIYSLLTYAAIGYVLRHALVEVKSRENRRGLTMFDPTNPLHLIMASSNRGSGDSGENLEEKGLNKSSIQKKQNLTVYLDNANERLSLSLVDPTLHATTPEAKLNAAESNSV